jgi:hypothetical protein
VARLIRNGSDDLRRLATENNSGEFFAMLFRLLQEQLGERLDCPASSITESVVDDRLARLGASPDTLTSLRELFQLCNQARYASTLRSSTATPVLRSSSATEDGEDGPMRGSAELNSVAAQFETVCSELQELKA